MSTTFRPVYSSAWMNEHGFGTNYSMGADHSSIYDAQVEGARRDDGSDDFLIGEFGASGDLVGLTGAHGSDLRGAGWGENSYRAIAAALTAECGARIEWKPRTPR